MISQADLAACASHIASTVEIFAVLTDPRLAPLAGSPADQELAEARQLQLGDGTWGEGPVRKAYAAALMSYMVALDEARAMAAR